MDGGGHNYVESLIEHGPVLNRLLIRRTGFCRPATKNVAFPFQDVLPYFQLLW